MARPLRIASRGDRREAIYEDDEDHEAFLRVLAEVVERYHWICHAFCLMTNHYHLLVETREGNLSQGMRHLDGVYTQASNRRHSRVGHLLQGRFKGILVDKDAYLLELSRYIVLNPVRAGMVAAPQQWSWSSYLAMLGMTAAPSWLAVDGLLSQFAQSGLKRVVAIGPLCSKAWDNTFGRGCASRSTCAAERGQVFLFSSLELHSGLWLDHFDWNSPVRCTTSPLEVMDARISIWRTATDDCFSTYLAVSEIDSTGRFMPTA